MANKYNQEITGKMVIKIDDDLNEVVEEEAPTVTSTVDSEDDSGELVLGKKKKPKRRALAIDDDDFAAYSDSLPARAECADISRSNLIDTRSDWPDYSYEEMLAMALRGRMNSDLGGAGTGEKRRFIMPVLQVQRAGSKRVALANFSRVCALLRREERHVLQFLLAELGTTGSIDGNHCLLVKGRFQERHFESVLIKYVVEYKKCGTCLQHDTDLIKEPHTRLYFLSCRACGSSHSVAPIKSGYSAVIGKRAVARRAAEEAAGLK